MTTCRASRASFEGGDTVAVANDETGGACGGWPEGRDG